jgi:serine/threonine protein kinase
MVGLSKDPDKNLVIVMELVEGGDLLALLRNAAEPLDWPLRVRMARELASAVAFLHARNVVHRDLKCVCCFLRSFFLVSPFFV